MSIDYAVIINKVLKTRKQYYENKLRMYFHMKKYDLTNLTTLPPIFTYFSLCPDPAGPYHYRVLTLWGASKQSRYPKWAQKRQDKGRCG